MDGLDELIPQMPPPIPGMRPPLGSPGGPVAAPKSSMGFVMPIYTICIIVFFVYTLTKILFRRQGAPYDPIAPDPQFRRRVFRDDSRSSPEKLGKKEADTIVTAISGLVAEVQQQMEASGAPNQQRQDVQDNARPYTNGTILLNSGPVQIVASEYKEASKEKTPEPVNEKESTPEPKAAEPTKVVGEPSPEAEESVLKIKESRQEAIQSSPEPEITEKCMAPISKLNESFPEPDVYKESILEPTAKLSEISSKSLVAEEPIAETIPIPEPNKSISEPKESISDPEVVLDPIPKSNIFVVETETVSEVSKDTTLNSDSKETLLGRSSPELKEYLPESTEFVDSADLKEYSSESIEPSLEIVESPFEPKLISSESEKPLKPEESLLDFKELSSELDDSFVLLKDSSTEPKEPLLSSQEPLLELNDPTPECVHPSLDPVISTSSDSQESNIIPKEIPLGSKEPDPLLAKYAPQPIDTTPIIEDPLTEPKESSLEPKALITEIKDYLLDPITTIPESKEALPKSEETVVLAKEPLLESKEPTTELNETSSKAEEYLQDAKEPFLEPKEPFLESKSPTPALEEPLQESIPDTKYPPEPTESDSNAVTPNLEQSTLGSVIIIPEYKNTVNLEHIIPEHEESVTHKESTPEPIEKSQQAKALIIDSSPESKFIEHLPEIEAPVVECSPESKFIKHSQEIETPVVECRPESELTEHSPEVDAPGLDNNSDLNTDFLRLKEPSPQSKETSPERKLSEGPKTVQVEENASVLEGTLLELEEAIADVDESISKQKQNKSENIKADLKMNDQIDQETSDDLLKVCEGTDAANDVKDDLAKTNDKFLQEERFVVVRRSTPDVIEENKTLRPYQSTPVDEYKVYTEADEEDIENAAVKVMGMEMTAHPVDGGEWPRDERPPPPASPAPPPTRAPHAAEDIKSIFLETEIPQQSRVLVAQFQEDRPPPAAHAPLVVSGKMTLSLIQDAPRETPERDPESTLDEFTTASAVTQPAAEKGEMESDEEIDEEIEVEEIEIEEEEEDEEEEDLPPVKTAVKK